MSSAAALEESNGSSSSRKDRFCGASTRLRLSANVKVTTSADAACSPALRAIGERCRGEGHGVG